MTTIGPAADIRGPIMREWPAWAVPAGAVDAWLTLQVALAVHAGWVPCQLEPERWWSSVEGVQVEAAAECGGCAVRPECAAYAAVAGERYGVWGGLRPADRRAVS